MFGQILENMMVRSVLLLVVCFAMLMPSYLVNNIDSHDWGGDFAMYIKQAQNVVEVVRQTDNNYIFNEENAVLGPKTYPIGFPLMLASVYAAYGNDISAFIDLIAVLSVLFGLLVFILLRDRIHWGFALLVAFGISYHTTLLFFKREVMADIPFALFALLALFAIDKKKWWVAALAMLMAVLTKSVGVSLLLATGFILFLQHSNASDQTLKSLLGKPITKLLGFVTISYFLLSNVVFQTASSEGYGSVWSDFELTTVVSNNFNYYFEFLRWFLFDSISEKPIGTIATGIFLVLSLIGWFFSSFKKLGAFEAWFPIYLLVLLAYPYHASGLRFLLPIIPLLFLYTATVLGSLNRKLKPLLVLAAALPFLFTYQRSADLIKDWPKDVEGPQSTNAAAMFDYVKNETEPEAAILFNKPRVLALYTDRASIGNGRYQSQESLITQLDSIPVDYLIHADALWNPGLDTLLMEQKTRTELLYDSAGFKVYRWIVR
jgi:hypothetical protein